MAFARMMRMRPCPVLERVSLARPRDDAGARIANPSPSARSEAASAGEPRSDPDAVSRHVAPARSPPADAAGREQRSTGWRVGQHAAPSAPPRRRRCANVSPRPAPHRPMAEAPSCRTPSNTASNVPARIPVTLPAPESGPRRAVSVSRRAWSIRSDSARSGAARRRHRGRRAARDPGRCHRFADTNASPRFVHPFFINGLFGVHRDPVEMGRWT